MLIRIDEKDPRPIYQQIVDEVRRAIVTGSIASDDALPSVRQLAADLRVNPNTVQQAYRELEREGICFVKRGQGTFIAEAKASPRVRSATAGAVAARALRDAYRHGLDAQELIDAIEKAAAGDEPAAKRGGR